VHNKTNTTSAYLYNHAQSSVGKFIAQNLQKLLFGLFSLANSSITSSYDTVILGRGLQKFGNSGFYQILQPQF